MIFLLSSSSCRKIRNQNIWKYKFVFSSLNSHINKQKENNMEEKKFYQEIRDNLAAFSSTNYQFSVIPFKIDENTIVFPINKINMISGIGESYFSSLKKKELTFKIIDETTPSSLGLYGTSIKPIALLLIIKGEVKLIKLEDDNLYNDIFSLLKTIVKKAIKKK